MLKKERQAYILHQLNLHNRVLSSLLCNEVNVSEDTIRRDLQELADDGKVIKVHGGALSHSFSEFHFIDHNNIYPTSYKKIIAQKAVGLIKDGMFVFTTGGSAIMELIQLLPPDLNATFVSGSLNAIMEYSNHPNIDVILIGDRISKTSKTTVGAEAVAQIKRIKPDISFLSVNAIDIYNGITDNDWEVVEIKKAVIESSQKVAALASSNKINTLQPVTVCDLTKIDYLITELKPTHPLLMPYVKGGLQVL